MKHIHLKRLLTIFEELLALNEDEQNIVLKDLESESKDLYSEITRLLANMRKADRFFKENLISESENPLLSRAMIDQIPQAGSFVEQPLPQLGLDVELPEYIGPFRILKLIGIGGMGFVYHASQAEPVRREVALKIVKKQSSISDNYTSFERECQALALMDNDHIARVYEVRRTEYNEPYCVMEYISDGQTITDFCDQQTLSIRERVALFLQACDGVSHAHSRGVIHGDLKPSNILVKVVNQKPSVKIIDFGIARAANPETFPLLKHSHEEGLIGTLAYMSPEQTRTWADVSTRSDIYSLGVLLYQLLTSYPMKQIQSFFEAPLEERLNRIQNLAHPKPSEHLLELDEDEMKKVLSNRELSKRLLIKEISGDLDWITTRALEKNPIRRYQTVIDLKEDLLSYLNHLPVKAHKGNKKYIIKKFVKRHFIETLAGSFTILIFLVGFSVTTISLVKTRKARDSEKEARLEAESVLANLKKTNTFYKDLLSYPHPYRDGPNVKLIDVLNKGESRLRNLTHQQPELEATLRLSIGEIYSGLGVSDKAEEQYRLALHLRASNYGRTSLEAFEAMNLLGMSLRNLRRLDEAEALFLEVINSSSSVSNHRDLEQLRAKNGLAIVYRLKQQFKKSEEFCNQILEFYRAEGNILNHGYLMATITLANVYRNQGVYSKAAENLNEALTLHRKLDGPKHPRTILVMNELAGTLYQQGRFAAAVNLYQDVVKIRSEIFGKDHPRTLDSLEGLALVLMAQGKTSDSVFWLSVVLDTRIKVLGVEHETSMRCMNNLATAYHFNGETATGIEILELALDNYTLQKKEDTAGALRTMNNLGDFLLSQNRLDEALFFLTRAYHFKVQKFGNSELTSLKTFFTIGQVYLQQKQYAKAQTYFSWVFECLSGSYEEEKEFLDLCKGYLGATFTGLGKFEKAEELILSVYERAMEGTSNQSLFGGFLVELYTSWNRPLKRKMYETFLEDASK